MNCLSETLRRHQEILIRLAAVFFFAAFPLVAKTDVDFDPNLDFAKYKTFAFIGGVQNLVMLSADPEVIDDQIHQMVVRELAKKGLREVATDQNSDLVVRYWANVPQQVNVASMGNWGAYGPYVSGEWAPVYNSVSASSGKQNTLIIDLIDARRKNLTWRLYLTRKITSADKDWKKADEEISKAFESYPPSDKEKDAKRKERASHPAGD